MIAQTGNELVGHLIRLLNKEAKLEGRKIRWDCKLKKIKKPGRKK